MRYIVIIFIAILILISNVFIEVSLNERRLIVKLFKLPIFYLKENKYQYFIAKNLNRFLSESKAKHKQEAQTFNAVKILNARVCLDTKVNNYILHNNFLSTLNFIYPYIFFKIKNKIENFKFAYQENAQNKFDIYLKFKINLITLVLSLLKGKNYERT